MKTPASNIFSIHKFKDGSWTEQSDALACEEPLEIVLKFESGHVPAEKTVSVTMRTPGNDAELAAGFLFTEGILSDPSDIVQVSQTEPNRIALRVESSTIKDLSRLERHFYTSSSCGVCGKSSMDAVRSVTGKSVLANGFNISETILPGLNQTVRNRQKLFSSTGGLHASALFNREGELKGIFEDVGRHNALDKLIGEQILNGHTALPESILFLSGRACFELIQKAVMAQIPIICALGAPSSLAVELAREFNITLIGFLKSDGFNLYSGPQRLRMS